MMRFALLLLISATACKKAENKAVTPPAAPAPGSAAVAPTPTPTPAPAPPPTAAPVLTTQGLGAVTATTKPTIAALTAVLPGAWANKEEAIGEGDVTETVALGADVSVYPNQDKTKIEFIYLTSAAYPTDKGTKVGDTVAAFAKQYPDAVCTSSTEEEAQLTCHAASFANVVFAVEHAGKLRDGKVDIDKVAGDKLVEIRWTAPK